MEILPSLQMYMFTQRIVITLFQIPSVSRQATSRETYKSLYGQHIGKNTDRHTATIQVNEQASYGSK